MARRHEQLAEAAWEKAWKSVWIPVWHFYTFDIEGRPGHFLCETPPITRIRGESEMNGIEGAGSAGFAYLLLNKTTRGSTAMGPAAERETKPGMRGAMTLCREFLGKAIAETGFVDIHSSTIDQLKSFVEHGSAPQDEAESDLDPRMAAEIAGHFGDTVIGEVNAILRLLARIDPERVAALLR
jgi:hypothetical protein